MKLKHMTTDQTVSDLMQRLSNLEAALAVSNKRIRVLEKRHNTVCPNCGRDTWEFRIPLCAYCEADIDEVMEG